MVRNETRAEVVVRELAMDRERIGDLLTVETGEVYRITAMCKLAETERNAALDSFQRLQQEKAAVEATLKAATGTNARLIGELAIAVEARETAMRYREEDCKERDRLKAALEEIARPSDCGCKPVCQCHTDATRAIEAEAFQSIARDALAAAPDPHLAGKAEPAKAERPRGCGGPGCVLCKHMIEHWFF